MIRLAREPGDGMRPKRQSRNMRLNHANLPLAGEPLPHLKRDMTSNAAPPVFAKNKKLCHVPDRGITRDFPRRAGLSHEWGDSSPPAGKVNPRTCYITPHCRFKN